MPENKTQWAEFLLALRSSDVGGFEIAIDPDGGIYAYEGGCYFDRDRFIPIDDFDGLEVFYLGQGSPQEKPIPPVEVAQQQSNDLHLHLLQNLSIRD